MTVRILLTKSKAFHHYDQKTHDEPPSRVGDSHGTRPTPLNPMVTPCPLYSTTTSFPEVYFSLWRFLSLRCPSSRCASYLSILCGGKGGGKGGGAGAGAGRAGGGSEGGAMTLDTPIAVACVDKLPALTYLLRLSNVVLLTLVSNFNAVTIILTKPEANNI